MALNIDDAQYSAWLGVNDSIEDGNFVTLQGKRAVWDFVFTEPNGRRSENCVIVDKHWQGFIDVSCTFQVSNVLCQRLAGNQVFCHVLR